MARIQNDSLLLPVICKLCVLFIRIYFNFRRVFKNLHRRMVAENVTNNVLRSLMHFVGMLDSRLFTDSRVDDRFPFFRRLSDTWLHLHLIIRFPNLEGVFGMA